VCVVIDNIHNKDWQCAQRPLYNPRYDHVTYYVTCAWIVIVTERVLGSTDILLSKSIMELFM